ncbi:hypothetical protein SAVIM40S_01431 [Streptomyces avidinii]
MKMNTGGFSYQKDEGKTRKNRIGDFFTVGDLGGWTRRAISSWATARST